MANEFYDEKTGDPRSDNRARLANRKLRRMTTDLHFTGFRNRKRKKYVKRVEGAHYVDLIVAVAKSLSEGGEKRG